MKLLLDEMYPYAIAEQLRKRGHDVVAVAEREDLRGTPDRSVFAYAQAEDRVLVTDDVGFLAVVAEHHARGEQHRGLILTANKRFPRGEPGAVGRLTRALDRLLSDEEAAPVEGSSFVHWLQ